MNGHRLVQMNRGGRAGGFDDPFTELLVDGVHAIGAPCNTSGAPRRSIAVIRRGAYFNPRAGLSNSTQK